MSYSLPDYSSEGALVGIKGHCKSSHASISETSGAFAFTVPSLFKVRQLKVESDWYHFNNYRWRLMVYPSGTDRKWTHMDAYLKCDGAGGSKPSYLSWMNWEENEGGWVPTKVKFTLRIVSPLGRVAQEGISGASGMDLGKGFTFPVDYDVADKRDGTSFSETHTFTPKASNLGFKDFSTKATTEQFAKLGDGSITILASLTTVQPNVN